MLNNRFLINCDFKFQLLTPLAIKAESDEDYIDYTVEKTFFNKALINGYQWASLFRRSASRVKDLHDIFEFIGNYDTSKRRVSPFWFSDSILDFTPDIRPGIKLHRKYLSVVEGALYFEEVIPPGYEINMKLKIYIPDNKEIESILSGLARIVWVIDSGIENIGSHWSYGYGRLEFIEGDYKVTSLNNDSELSRGSIKPEEPSFRKAFNIIKVKASITEGQLFAIHIKEPYYTPDEWIEKKAFPDFFAFRSLRYNKEKNKPEPYFIIPGKALRQGLFSVPIERRLRTEGEDICETPQEYCTCSRCKAERVEKKEKKGDSGCKCLRCMWFGSGEKRSMVAVTDAEVNDANSVLLKRIQLCEHSFQNINLFTEEFLTGGVFKFKMFLDNPDDKLLTYVKDCLEEMKEKAPAGWYRLGSSSTVTGAITIKEYDEERYGI
jgi:CRISPR/Cas system CSM-associated protein Csm3 (group 7 of RAMP superfamily)